MLSAAVQQYLPPVLNSAFSCCCRAYLLSRGVSLAHSHVATFRCTRSCQTLCHDMEPMAGHIDTCDEPPCLDSATTLKGLWLLGWGLLLHVTYALLNLVIRSACARLVHWVREPRSKQDATFLSHEGVDFANLDYLNSARQMIVVQGFNPYANRTRNQMQQIGKTGINFERLHEALLASDNPSVLQNSSAAVQALTIEMSQDELAATYNKFQKLRRG